MHFFPSRRSPKTKTAPTSEEPAVPVEYWTEAEYNSIFRLGLQLFPIGIAAVWAFQLLFHNHTLGMCLVWQATLMMYAGKTQAREIYRGKKFPKKKAAFTPNQKVNDFVGTAFCFLIFAAGIVFSLGWLLPFLLKPGRPFHFGAALYLQILVASALGGLVREILKQRAAKAGTVAATAKAVVSEIPATEIAVPVAAPGHWWTQSALRDDEPQTQTIGR